MIEVYYSPKMDQIMLYGDGGFIYDDLPRRFIFPPKGWLKAMGYFRVGEL